MQAVEFLNPGENAEARVTPQPVPVPQTGEVLIRVHAAGINRPDLAQMAGRYPPPPGASTIPGLEVAGEVVAVNGETAGLSEGDKVCALVSGGGYAEYCTAPALQCLPLPDGYDFIRAAALPENFFTVWVNLFEHGRLQKGEKLLVHGGSSGIGTAAVQIASALGIDVAVTAGSDEKCAACLELGATTAINYKTDDFVEVLGENSIDVVLDMVGGDYVPRNIKILRDRGRHVSIAGLRGWTTEISIFDIMRKRLVLTGSTLRPRSIAEKSIIAKALQENVWPLLSTEKIAPVIHAVYPLDDVSTALSLLESSAHIGKIILKIDA
ncbi:MAG: NAD(P)H-quinone oxidoreductase [Pseudomonadota bacterium]|nr:NAD(P)H-quinone oxidoreductase [Pseudomonadota bacterium]QKK06606.1 MAG: NAD(P)H-quinone oxidoreductase [Pseudomonadota bacterium]